MSGLAVYEHVGLSCAVAGHRCVLPARTVLAVERTARVGGPELRQHSGEPGSAMNGGRRLIVMLPSDAERADRVPVLGALGGLEHEDIAMMANLVTP